MKLWEYAVTIGEIAGAERRLMNAINRFRESTKNGPERLTIEEKIYLREIYSAARAGLSAVKRLTSGLHELSSEGIAELSEFLEGAGNLDELAEGAK